MNTLIAFVLLSSIARADIPAPEEDTDTSSSKCDHVSPMGALPAALVGAAMLATRRRSRNR